MILYIFFYIVVLAALFMAWNSGDNSLAINLRQGLEVTNNLFRVPGINMNPRSLVGFFSPDAGLMKWVLFSSMVTAVLSPPNGQYFSESFIGPLMEADEPTSMATVYDLAVTFFDDRILEWRSLSMEESIILKKIIKLVPVTWGNFLNKMQVEGVIVPQLPEDIMESVYWRDLPTVRENYFGRGDTIFLDNLRTARHLCQVIFVLLIALIGTVKKLSWDVFTLLRFQLNLFFSNVVANSDVGILRTTQLGNEISQKEGQDFNPLLPNANSSHSF